MVGVFIDVRSVDKAFFLALLEETSCVLGSVAGLLLEEILASRRVVRAAWRDVTTVTDGRDGALGGSLTDGTSI